MTEHPGGRVEVPRGHLRNTSLGAHIPQNLVMDSVGGVHGGGGAFVAARVVGQGGDVGLDAGAYTHPLFGLR